MNNKVFIFESYTFDPKTLTASFTYSFDGEMFFTERAVFSGKADSYDKVALQSALFLSFIITGVSYYKLFPNSQIEWKGGGIDEWQSNFLNKIYQEGLGQYAFENELKRENLAQFVPENLNAVFEPTHYEGQGVMSLQSGGKDSLLTAEALQERHQPFDSFYISSSETHPAMLDGIGNNLYVTRRHVDIPAIMAAREQGALNGHVPVTFIVLSLALIQGVLLNKRTILASIGHEGEEPHAMIDDLPVTHQWSKTWDAEVLFSGYVSRYIAPELQIGSPLRRFTELRVAELFIEKAWAKYGHTFSSCNKANYKQGADNTELKWCGNCPKCANSYLLFAPFIDSRELKSLFGGEDLFIKPTLQDTFKGLLGIDGAMKPFECVGEVDELRLAYHMAQSRGGYEAFGFWVPLSSYDYLQQFPSQRWSEALFGAK